jgi:hypothetical protein
VRFVDHAVGDLDRRRQRELRRGRHDAVCQGAGDGDRLEDGARLVGVGDDPVALEARVGAEAVVLDPRHVDDGIELAGACVEHDGDGRRRAVVAHGALQDLLGRVLDVGVEREPHALAAHRLFLAERLQRAPRRVAHDEGAAGLAGEIGLVVGLDAGQTVVVEPREADDLRREPVERIDTGLLGVAADARQVEGERAFGPLRRHLAGHEGETARGVGERRAQRLPPALALDLESAAQRVAGGVGVVQHVRRRVDGLARLPEGEVVAVAVDDRPAVSGERQRRALLSLCDARETLG